MEKVQRIHLLYLLTVLTISCKLWTKSSVTLFQILYMDLAKIHERDSVLKFLEITGAMSIEIYDRLDYVFVYPKNFEESREFLKNNKAVIISGPSGYGKTFAAMKFLLEIYKKGYKPNWYAGTEKMQRNNVRTQLLKTQPEDTVIYYEDPFGKA